MRSNESNQTSAELRESIQDIRLQLDSLLMQALQGKAQIEQGLAQIRSRLLAPVLDSLDLAMDARTNSQLDQRMRRYLGDVRVDVEARTQSPKTNKSSNFPLLNIWIQCQRTGVSDFMSPFAMALRLVCHCTLLAA